MNKYESGNLEVQQGEIWSLSLEQLNQIIFHINTIIIIKTEELLSELNVTEQEQKKENKDSIMKSKVVLQEYTRDYITFLTLLISKLEEYRDDMAETFQIKDISRKIYLDYFGLNEWIKQIEEDLDINSEHINKVVSDSEKFKEWEVQKDREFVNKVNINNEENETLDLRRQERLKYEEAKKIYKKVSNEIKETLKFQEQIDYIIKNISKTKDIKNIEDTFEVEELRQIIELAQKGTHNALEEVIIEEAEKKNKKKI